MRRILAAAALGVALAGCGGNGDAGTPAPSPSSGTAACKSALAEQLKTGMETPDAPSGTRPPACAGVDDTTLQRLVGEIIASAVPTPATSAAPSFRATADSWQS
jgi:hypothetical protein